MFLLRFSLSITAYCYIIFQSDIDIWKLFQVLFAISGSITENSAFFVCGFVTNLSSFGVIIGNFAMKNEFIALLQLFHEQNFTPQKQLCNLKTFLFLVIIFGMVVDCFWICLFIFTIIEEFNVHLYVLVFCCIDFIVFSLMTHGPWIGFLIMYCEVCQQLDYWAKSLIQKVYSLDKNFDLCVTNECLQFSQEGLKRSSQAFSSMLLWITTILLSMMICNAFLAMSLFFVGIPPIGILMLIGSLLFDSILYCFELLISRSGR